MANKLPWFTHDHVARNDEFMQLSMDKFGHFGYAAYFMILEIIHEHGVGGVVSMPKGRLAQNLRSKWPQVHQYLAFCQTAGKVQFTIIGDQVELQNKKFIERQRKMKSNATSMLQQRSGKAPREVDVDVEGEREKTFGLRPVDICEYVDKSVDKFLEADPLQRRCKIRGAHYDRKFIDIPYDEAEKYLSAIPSMGDSQREGLKARVALKHAELHPRLRPA